MFPRSLASCLLACLLILQEPPLDPTFLFQCITANIIYSIVFGERFDYTDHQFLHLLDLMYQMFSLLSSISSQVSAWGEKSIQGRVKKLICGWKRECLRAGRKAETKWRERKLRPEAGQV